MCKNKGGRTIQLLCEEKCPALFRINVKEVNKSNNRPRPQAIRMVLIKKLRKVLVSDSEFLAFGQQIYMHLALFQPHNVLFLANDH